MKKEDKIKTKMEFSKKIFIVVITIFIIVIGFSMAIMWKTETSDGLMYLIPSVSTLAATCVGFYYWKAKMENMIKLGKENRESIEEAKQLEDDMNNFEQDMSEFDIEIDEEDY